MKLDGMRNSKTSEVGHQCSSSVSPHTHSPITDVSLMQESLSMFVQQKTNIDQLLQHSIVGHTGDGSHIDYSGFVSKTDAAISDVKQVEAGMMRNASVLSGCQQEMSPSSVSNLSRPVEPLMAELDKGHSRDSRTSVNRDLSQATLVQTPVRPTLSLSDGTAFHPTSVPDTKFADSYMSLPGQSLGKSFESSQSRSVLMNSADKVEDTLTSTGSQHQQHVYARVGQPVNPTDRTGDVLDSSAVEDIMHDTVSEVSSLPTDLHQSESTSYTQLDDWKSASSQSVTVEAAVKNLQPSLSNLIQSGSDDASSATDAYDYHREAELLKQSSAEATFDQQIALSDDEYCLSEAGLSYSYSESCGLSPVPKCSPFSVMQSVQPVPATQLDRATTARLGRGTKLRSAGACNDSSVAPSCDRNMQRTDNSSRLGIDAVLLHPYSVGSDEQKVTYNTEFISTAHLEFTPLVELSYGRESPESRSYDGDNEQPLTDRQSYNDDRELKNWSGRVVEQQLAADETVNSYDVNGSLSCSYAARGTQTVGSHSPASVNQLQPYQ